MGIQRFTVGCKGMVSEGYKSIQWLTGDYKGIRGIGRDNSGIQGFTMDCKGHIRD